MIQDISDAEGRVVAAALERIRRGRELIETGERMLRISTSSVARPLAAFRPSH
jgi:hypothetical protein